MRDNRQQPVEAVLMEDMFGRWSFSMMNEDGTGRQSRSWDSESEALKALSLRFPDIKVSYA